MPKAAVDSESTFVLVVIVEDMKNSDKARCAVCGQFVSPTGKNKDRVRIGKYTPDSVFTVESQEYVHIKCVKDYSFN